MPRYEGGNIFLDYLDSTSRVSDQQIIFGSNLLNLDDFILMESTATAIYPTGKDGLTVESVNPTGKPYIINNAMYNRYGMIATAAKFDTEDAAELYRQAKLTLSSLAVLNRSIKLTAFDLSLANSTVDSIEVGDSVQVISAPHELDTTMICTAKTTDLIDPANCAITLGKSFASISGIVSNKAAQAMSDTSLIGNEAVTLTANTDRITNVSYTAKYNELLGAVFVRIYGTINAALYAGDDYDLFSIESRLPNSITALSVKCNKNAMAVAGSRGVISVRPLENGINGYDIYITGFWFV